MDEVQVNNNFPILMLTGDVNEMYPSIPLKEVFLLIESMYETIDNNEFLSKNQYMETLKIVLYGNVLSFNNIYYKQLDGLPMGSSCSPQLSSLFLWNLEQNIPY